MSDPQVKVQDVREASKGVLQKQLYVVFTIIRAGSLAAAKAVAAEDPMHRRGARSFTVRPWLLNEGTVTVRITYSDGKRELV